ncbi:hypothetical protein L6452_11794 [Arctium lappa]|uniref:Uncharacterized protein n=1 Tax=Arctium lappa TaxID=4217 RepID=A0ACB9DQA7_ARCLA|nr:hypothetical protein L6452_11794 [Arctium lappa]
MQSYLSSKEKRVLATARTDSSIPGLFHPVDQGPSLSLSLSKRRGRKRVRVYSLPLLPFAPHSYHHLCCTL